MALKRQLWLRVTATETFWNRVLSRLSRQDQNPSFQKIPGCQWRAVSWAQSWQFNGIFTCWMCWSYETANERSIAQCGRFEALERSRITRLARPCVLPRLCWGCLEPLALSDFKFPGRPSKSTTRFGFFNGSLMTTLGRCVNSRLGIKSFGQDTGAFRRRPWTESKRV